MKTPAGMTPVADFPRGYKGAPFADSKYQEGAQKIPGEVMCAYYDLGGEGIAYHDADAKNSGSGGLNPLDGKYLNEFRASEGTDASYTKDFADFWDGEAVKPPQDMLYVGWTEPGEWMNYTVDVAEDGDYTVDILYTSNKGGEISLDVNGTPLERPITIASTNDPKDTTAWRQWHHWNTSKNAATVRLSKGRNLLTLHVVDKGNMNFGLMDFKLAKSVTVAAAYKDPEGEWKDYPTRTLADLPSGVREKKDSDLDAYGGQLPAAAEATGFFHTTKRDDRWWLVDPTGSLCIYKGMSSVSPLSAPGAKATFESKFGSKTNWAAATTDLLREHGFIAAGAWSDAGALRSAGRPLAYTPVLNFMSGYGRKRGGTTSQPGHTGYPKDCIFVFDPEFESFCDEHARTLAENKDDPWLIGYFSDNELPFGRASLSNYLALPENDLGHEAALAWLRARRGDHAGAEDIVSQDQSDFSEFVADRYFRITSSAIRKYDPNHLFLGSRFYGSNLSQPEMFRAGGRWADVISVNWYHAWTPDPERLAMWERESHKPVVITEWYAKAMDSGLANHGGAGWVVKTQRDRGMYYQNFTLGLLESKACLGWDWFKYADNDPEATGTDASNRDANKGVLSNRYEPYSPLLDAMKQINERTFLLIEYFDQEAKTRHPAD